MRNFWIGLLVAGGLLGASPDWVRAQRLYLRTEYRESLAALKVAPTDADTLQLSGQDWFMLGDYKPACEAFEKAAALHPNDPTLIHWLGRAYGRRAESANPLAALGLAAKTRQMFEKAVELNPADKDSLGDLLDFYLDAPGFLGGGMHKAEMLTHLILKQDPAEGHYSLGLVAEKKKDFATAEKEFRTAAGMSPRQVGHVVVLARYLANHEQVSESDALFEEAARMSPNDPKVMFARAATYIKENRNLEAARRLLRQYVQSSLTPNDPAREHAEAMLKKLGA